MTAGAGLLAHIAQAEGHVRNARRSWDPTKSEGCEQCAEHLRKAVEFMLFARQAAAGGTALPGAKAQLTRLHHEVEVLSRLVDSAIAFSRGLALRLISEEPVHAELKG
ncbi:MAG TPA: hypothetical protein VKT49_17315 [Bryobacteraceae bacterium]|nr:hypothetical protein [Bryobacteraceae bacterium]